MNGITYSFKDSLRIFPISLNELCKVFKTTGKLSEYNVKWNNVSVLHNIYSLNKLIDYAKQDVISLHNALKTAQNNFIKKYGVDITSILSLPSLALKIFRLNFLKINIKTLNENQGLKETFHEHLTTQN